MTKLQTELKTNIENKINKLMAAQFNQFSGLDYSDIVKEYPNIGQGDINEVLNSLDCPYSNSINWSA